MNRPLRLPTFSLAVLLLSAGTTTAQSLPGTPGNLSAVVVGNHVTLSWTAPSAGATPTGYALVARLSASAAVIATLPVGAVLSTSVTAPNGSYYVTVRAFNQQASGPESPGVMVTVPNAATPPGMPQNLNAMVNANSVTLFWEATGVSATSYTISAALTASGPPMASFSVATPMVTINAVPSGTYYVRVTAANSAGVSAPSDVLAVVAPQATPGNLSVAQVNTQSIGSTQIGSSTRLAVSWAAPAGAPVAHYELVAIDSVTGARSTTTLPATTTSTALSNLKANTVYTIAVKACLTTACTLFSAAAANAETPKEYWQLQGTGNTVAGLTPLVSDGNARLSATRFGLDAGAMAGRVQLYYGPRAPGSPLAVAVASQAADAANPASYLSFTSRVGSSGLTSPATATSLVQTVATGQGVPMTAAMGSKVRLFFEAQGADGKTRVLSLDSQDGFIGQDFNAGSAGICSTAADYEGGGCVPTVVIGVEGDAVASNARIHNARQHKVAWPTLDSAHWDGAAGTFMVFTVDNISGCSTSGHNHAYAVWQGTSWAVQYAGNGCPKLLTSAQAAFPMHLGGARYKMYYGDPSISGGRVSGSRLPFLGPKKLIYSDGQASGSAAVVDFEDWEAQAAARDVVFLWPTGDRLDDRAEGYIDDFHFLAPTGSLDLQVMYLTITDGVIIPISAAAVLRNP